MADDYSAERYAPLAYQRCGNLDMTFDGSTLKLFGGKALHFYPAMSGNVRDVELRIPEGRYWIAPHELWTFGFLKHYKVDLQHKLLSWAGAPSADKYYDSWGMYRITIHPYPETDTDGRGGFFIHGGAVLGSIGCIDLGHLMDSFIKDLKSEVGAHATDKRCFIELTVKYSS